MLTAPAQPGCLYYLSCWYTRKELGVRTTYLYIGSLLSGAFFCLVAVHFLFWVRLVH